MTTHCNYCNKEFTNQGSLKRHQQTTKYCIKIQAEQFELNNIESEIEYISYPCEYCKKEFSTQTWHNTHIEKCPQKDKYIISQLKEELIQKDEKYQEELYYYKDELSKKDESHKDELSKKDESHKDELSKKDNELSKKDNELSKKDESHKDEINKKDTQIAVLEKEVELLEKDKERTYADISEIAKQPKNTTTTNNQNKILITTPIDMSKEHIKSIISNSFDCNYLVGGQKGAANFVCDNILKDEKGELMYLCSDPSRQTFQYKNADGTIVKDVRATKLTQTLFEAGLKQKTHALASEKMLNEDSDTFMTYTTHFQEIRDMEEEDSSAFRAQLVALTTK